jgi:hypothetical protein
LKRRTYPRVDLNKLSNWISALSSYGLPLIELSARKLSDNERRGSLSLEVKQKIQAWKKLKGLEDPDDLEYKYFLESIEAILSRPLENEDMYVPLFQDLSIGKITSFKPNRKRIYYLSKLGCNLANYWGLRQHHYYEATLFWSIIRCTKFNPLIQSLISNPRFYQEGFHDQLIPSRDGISRALVRKWLQHFFLIKNNKPDEAKLAILLLYALVLELNCIIEHKGSLKQYVGVLCETVSEKFSITATAVGFDFLLEWLYSHLDRQVIVGFPSGRGHLGLPSKPSIQILEINGLIPLSIIGEIQSYEIQKAISFGGYR